MAQRKGILSVYRYEPVRSTSLENTLNASGCTPMSVQINLQSAGVTRCLTDFYVMLELQKNVFFTMKNKFTSQNIGASWHTQKTIILVVRTKFLATNSCKQNIYTSWADKSAAFLNAFRSASILRFVSFSLSNSLWNLRLIFQFWKASLQIQKIIEFSATIILQIPMQSSETTTEKILTIAYLLLELLSVNEEKLLTGRKQRWKQHLSPSFKVKYLSEKKVIPPGEKRN